MRSKGLLGLALAATIGVACNSNRDNTTADNPNATVGTGGEVRDDDSSRAEGVPRSLENWVQDIVRHNTAEIELGKIAAEHAANAEVKKYGQMMVNDHTMAGSELKQTIAGKIQVTEEMDEKHRDLAERLRGLHGAEFDREFMNAMVDGHQEVKDMLESRANEKPNNEPVENNVNQWAAKTLPKVEQHLQQAEQLRDKLQDRRNTTN